MNILDIAKSVGTGLIRDLVPGGALIIDAVNQFLPENNKLPANATGDRVTQTINSLPPDLQAQILLKQFDVQVEQIKAEALTFQAMLASDAVVPQTTRPYIARGCFHVLAFCSVVVVALWAYGVAVGDAVMAQAVMGGWPFVLAVLGPFVLLLRAYFGILKDEQRNKLDASNGLPTTAGGILDIFKR